MKILVASPYLPWPLDSGGNAAQFSTLQCMAQDHEFTLLCPTNNKVDERNAQELAKRLPNVKLRVVSCAAPARHPVLRAALWSKQKARDLVKGTHSRFAETAPFYPFSPLHYAYIEALADEISKGPDLCQVEFAEMMPLASWLPAGLPKLFIHHQIHFIYAERFMDLHGRSTHSVYLTEWMRAQENLYLSRFDGIVTFSETDRAILSRSPGLPPVHISPFPIPVDVGIADTVPSGADGRFLFLGSEGHGPNRGALTWLLTEIWPKILAKIPSARLIVIGAWSESWIKTAGGHGVTYAGFVPDLASVLRGGTMLVPIRIGSGIRTKILAALAQGVPTVTTAVGAEGLLVKDGEDILIRDTPESLAEASVRLLQDKDLWQRVAEKGRTAVIKNYSATEVRRRRNQIYSELVASVRAGVNNADSTIAASSP